MKLAPIQLEGYALLDLAYRANQEHKADQPTQYRDEDMVVATQCQQDAKESHCWSVTLSLRVQPRAEANAPYYISLQLSGVVRTLPQLQNENLELLVKVNGASLLYGVAREVVRQVTSIGPFPPLLIPSVTFRPDPPSAPSPTEIAPSPPERVE